MRSSVQPAAPTADQRTRERINRTLGGPVMTILAALEPALGGLPQDRALEIVLSDCDLLTRCLRLFAAERSRFKAILVDRRDRPVENDNSPLACGRSVNQVIAMIIRSAAKRHFHMRLDRREPWQAWSPPTPSRLDRPAGQGLGAMLQWIRSRPEPPPVEKSAAEQLYDSIRQYLLHDWQAPIIPQYARMSPPEVRALGARILDFRDAHQLAAYLDTGRWPPLKQATPEPAPPPAPEQDLAPMPPPPSAEAEGMASLPSAPLSGGAGRARLSDVLSLDGRAIRMDTVAPILMRPEIRTALGHPSQPELLRVARVVATTGSGAVRRLVVDFGLPAESMSVVLATAAMALPQEVYERIFGRRGELTLILALVQKARAAGLGPDSDEADFADFIRDLFKRFQR